jgi:hypothetical protein
VVHHCAVPYSHPNSPSHMTSVWPHRVHLQQPPCTDQRTCLTMHASSSLLSPLSLSNNFLSSTEAFSFLNFLPYPKFSTSRLPPRRPREDHIYCTMLGSVRGLDLKRRRCPLRSPLSGTAGRTKETQPRNNTLPLPRLRPPPPLIGQRWPIFR